MAGSLSRGISMVELMVTLALVSIFMLLAAPNLAGWMQNRKVRTAGESMMSGLQLARSEAIRRNRAVQFSLTGGALWTVGCNPVDASVDAQGFVACPAVIQANPSGEGAQSATVSTSQVQAVSGAASSSPVFNGTVLFDPLGRVAASSVPAGHVGIFEVSNPAGGACATSGGTIHCLQIRVTNAGQVRLCDPAMVNTDARAC